MMESMTRASDTGIVFNADKVGASLLAMAAAHSTSIQADPPLSRAGSLPQGIGAGFGR
ncbi:protein of unknown function [Pseudomonas mediterranea]